MRSYIAVAFSSRCSLAGVDYEHFSLTQVFWYIALPHALLHNSCIKTHLTYSRSAVVHSRILPLTSGNHPVSTGVKSVHYIGHIIHV